MDLKVLLSLWILIAIILIAGGFLFQFLEAVPQEPTTIIISYPINDLTNGTFSSFNTTALESIVNDLVQKYASGNSWKASVTFDGSTIQAKMMAVADDPWTYYNSLAYTESLITTIGYGNVSPKTGAGMAMSCIIGCLGKAILFSSFFKQILYN